MPRNAPWGTETQKARTEVGNYGPLWTSISRIPEPAWARRTPCLNTSFYYLILIWSIVWVSWNCGTVFEVKIEKAVTFGIRNVFWLYGR